MEDLSSRTAQEVLDDHLNLAEDWGAQEGAEHIAEEDIERAFEEDIRRNVSEDIVILINRGTFRGHEGSGSWHGCCLRNCPNTAPSSTPTRPSKEGWGS